MKGFIIDSTYKENIITDNNQFILNSSSHSLSNKLINTYNLPIVQTNSSHITHHQNNKNFSNYNMIDYL